LDLYADYIVILNVRVNLFTCMSNAPWKNSLTHTLVSSLDADELLAL
jgi:hypothetical protein